MSALIKLLVIAISMNICLTIVGISVGEFDMLNQFVNIEGDTVQPTEQFSLQNGSSIPLDTGSSTGLTSSAEGFSFVDALKLTFNFILLVLVGLFFPVYWGFALALPLWFTLILTLQTIVSVTSVTMVIRGVSV